MKICILSMQMVPNFGSLLQSYALKRILEEFGHTVSFLDIEPNQAENNLLCGKRNLFPEEMSKGCFFFSKLKKVDKYALNRLRIKWLSREQELRFEEFRNSVLGIREKANDVHYEYCVIGSDEVFNCLAGASWGFTSQLFGNVAQADRVITYAASCGATVFEDVPEQVRERIRQAFGGISAFSVRDQNTLEFVSQMTERNVSVHFDPAFVYNFEEEIRTAEFPKELPQRYCVVYSYYNRIRDPKDIQQIKKFCKKWNMKIVSVGAPQMWIRTHLVVTPFETLKVFQNAAFVITDTFHGTVFAAKCARKFAVLIRRSNANKLGDLIERLQLQAHLVRSLDELEVAFAQENDTVRVLKLSEKGRKKMKQYFIDSISLSGEEML